MSGISVSQENKKSPKIVTYTNYDLGDKVKLNKNHNLNDEINLHKMKGNYIIFTANKDEVIQIFPNITVNPASFQLIDGEKFLNYKEASGKVVLFMAKIDCRKQ